MKFYSFICLLSCLLMSFGAFAEAKKGKASLTEREKKLAAEGMAHMKEAEKLPPPSKHMQDKMQSSVPTKEDKAKKK